MKGLLHGIGAGAAFSAAALVPLPVLALGGVLLLASATTLKPEVEPPEEPLLTQAELDEIEIFAELVDNAPNAEARKALIEEFYPGFRAQ